MTAVKSTSVMYLQFPDFQHNATSQRLYTQSMTLQIPTKTQGGISCTCVDYEKKSNKTFILRNRNEFVGLSIFLRSEIS